MDGGSPGFFVQWTVLPLWYRSQHQHLPLLLLVCALLCVPVHSDMAGPGCRLVWLPQGPHNRSDFIHVALLSFLVKCYYLPLCFSNKIVVQVPSDLFLSFEVLARPVGQWAGAP